MPEILLATANARYSHAAFGLRYLLANLGALAERAGLAMQVGAKPGDCVFFSAGPAKASRALLGAARGEIDAIGLK